MWTQSCGPHSDDLFPGPAAGMRTELLKTKQKRSEKSNLISAAISKTNPY